MTERAGIGRHRGGSRRSRGGIRITKVGLWFLLFAGVVAIAATNTGNNSLYMVLAAMVGLIVACRLVASLNASSLAVSLDPPDEVFAGRPAFFGLEVRNRSWWFSRRGLLVVAGRAIERQKPLAVHVLARAGRKNSREVADSLRRSTCELLFSRRGLRNVGEVAVVSLFPLGLFRGAKRYSPKREVLVFPSLLEDFSLNAVKFGKKGEEAAQRPGWGHELHGLRRFRPGDDPRSVHWKQSARLNQLIFKVRESEESLRISVVLDNSLQERALAAIGEPDEEVHSRFEELVKRAATACVLGLDEGLEVELVTRDQRLPFGTGAGHRFRLLECLALTELSRATGATLIKGDPHALELVLSLGRDDSDRKAPGLGRSDPSLAGFGMSSSPAVGAKVG